MPLRTFYVKLTLSEDDYRWLILWARKKGRKLATQANNSLGAQIARFKPEIQEWLEEEAGYQGITVQELKLKIWAEDGYSPTTTDEPAPDEPE